MGVVLMYAVAVPETHIAGPVHNTRACGGTVQVEGPCIVCGRCGVTGTDTALLPVDQLAAGLAWLFDTAQPDDAIVQHHGHASAAFGRRTYGFCPRGHTGHPVISVDVVDTRWLSDEGRWTATLYPGEVKQLAAVLTALGRHPVDTWNGHPAPTGSIELDDPIHPTLDAAVARYRAGCPDHPEQSVFCRCDRWRADWGRAVHPVWPEERDHAEVPTARVFRADPEG